MRNLAEIKQKLKAKRLRVEKFKNSSLTKELIKYNHSELELALKDTKIGVYRRALSTSAKPTDSWLINIEPLFGYFDNKGRTLEQLIKEARFKDFDQVEKLHQKSIHTENKKFELEFDLKWPDGSYHTLILKAKIVVDEKGIPLYRTGIISDITDSKKLEKELYFIQDRLEIALTLTQTGLFKNFIQFKSLNERKLGEIVPLSENWMFNIPPLYGYPADIEFSKNLEFSHIHEADKHLITDDFSKALLKQLPLYEAEYRVTWTDGSLHWLHLKANISWDERKGGIYVTGSLADVTKKKIDANKIEYLSNHDGLTGLANRGLFSHVLGKAIVSAQRYNRKFAVMFIDLDRFKVINDTLGHDAGDILLKEISVRLNNCIRSGDMVARLGGDEFVVLIEEVQDREELISVAKKILNEVILPIKVRGQDCRVTASIGISLYPADSDNEHTLMKNADIAMYLAKEEGKNNFQFYTEEIKNKSFEKLSLESNLRTALENEEFSLVYQAKLDFKTGDIKGVEALLRWDNLNLGHVSPTRFIPVAEESGLIISIGKWVLRKACQQSRMWLDQGLPPICIAVNLSPRQFSDEHLIEDIAQILKETNIPGEYLELRLTEGMVMHNPERVVRLLKAVKAMGVRIAIDDFGTGYSSLSHIQQFPIDTLKVDRSFVRQLEMSKNDQGITKAIIAMGKTLSMTVIAEGVENQEQADFLRNEACDEMQGFYFSKPISSDHFVELYRNHLKKPKPM